MTIEPEVGLAPSHERIVHPVIVPARGALTTAVGLSPAVIAFVPSPIRNSSWNPLEPVDPVGPVLPVCPDPVLPVAPVGPVDPVFAVCPVSPVAPVPPTAPVGPVDPVFAV